MAKGMHKPKSLQRRKDAYTEILPKGSTKQPGSLKK